ncbi:MAG: Tex family protein [Bacteroidales bacterium]|nr:Tex family protein [Bacteroidales bacterium]MDD4641140.1 Tex family protein [Bacteroidales bacterium]
MLNILAHIALMLQLKEAAVKNTLNLLDEGASIPFISRYRKENTGGLDEVQLGSIADLYEELKTLEKRKESILQSIEEQGKLSPELKQQIEACTQKNELEDLYLPYRPKRRTRAQIAREKGLEPLAALLMRQGPQDLGQLAARFTGTNVTDIQEALDGASDIIAEWVNENSRGRQQLRNHFRRSAIIHSVLVKGKESEGQNYRDYFDYSEALRSCSSHRFLAMIRGMKEGYLSIALKPDDEACQSSLERLFVKADNPAGKLVANAVKDAYKRLLKPSIENEFLNLSKEKADQEAIQVFATNLKQLLLAPPLGQKRVLAIDPGYKSGCKLVCLDAQGKLLHNENIFPHLDQRQKNLAAKKMAQLVESYQIEAIAIGNGTASRETEAFVKHLRLDRVVRVYVVSENGASVYSASSIAREEFPEYDVTVRGAVSIGRRLCDPLAELVKIDPKAIGVGQYQHDVDQHKLKKALDQTVVHCVNAVGVNLNTASKHLLAYVSGLNAQSAARIVDYRDEKGAFNLRSELLRVPSVGPKSFEQAAGFLRIPGSAHPLDNTAVHPERYALVEKMASDLGCSTESLIRDAALRKQIPLENYLDEHTGWPTLNDIMQELDKPGRDPRAKIEVFEFDPKIRKFEDLQAGMVLPGIVTNITNFGCFVDIGIKENGLLHLSQMADRFVSQATEVVSLHQHIKVRILSIEPERRRIQLSLKNLA